MGLLDAFRKTPATSEELKARASRLQRQLNRLVQSNELVDAATRMALGEDGGERDFKRLQSKIAELRAEIEKLQLASQGVSQREAVIRQQERERQIAATRSYARSATEKFVAAMKAHDDCVARIVSELIGPRKAVRAAYAEWLSRVGAVDWEDSFSIPDLPQRLEVVMQGVAIGKALPLQKMFEETLAEIEDQLSGAAKPRPVEDDTPAVPLKTETELRIEWLSTIGLAPHDPSIQRIIEQCIDALGRGDASTERARQNAQYMRKYFPDPSELHYARAKEMYQAGLETVFGQNLHKRCPGLAIDPSFLWALYDRSVPGVKLETANLPRDPTPAQLANIFPNNPEALAAFNEANARRVAATPTIGDVTARHQRSKINLAIALGLPVVPPKPEEPVEQEPEEDVGSVEEILTGAAEDLGIAPAETPAQPAPDGQTKGLPDLASGAGHEKAAQPEKPATDDDPPVKW